MARKTWRKSRAVPQTFLEKQIVATLSQTLGWSHFRELLPPAKSVQRGFYAGMCRVERGRAGKRRGKITDLIVETTQ